MSGRATGYYQRQTDDRASGTWGVLTNFGGVAVPQRYGVWLLTPHEQSWPCPEVAGRWRAAGKMLSILLRFHCGRSRLRDTACRTRGCS